MSAQYPQDFTASVEDVLKWEGGYVNDPDDPGGETNFGISKRSYPTLDIKGLTRDGAIAIYYRDWWVKYKLETDVREDLRAKVFSMMVLMGPGPALSLARRAVGLEDYKRKCVHHFEAIVAMHPISAKYLRGWTRRAMA
jgi:lysozyme family protein